MDEPAERIASRPPHPCAGDHTLTRDATPSVLFLCVHNAGRSQMALGFFQYHAAGRALAWSGGSEPADGLNPTVVQAMHERGIDISGQHPRSWTDEGVRAADVVITMGCGDACPYFPGIRYEEWDLDDPAGRDVAAGRSATRRPAGCRTSPPTRRPGPPLEAAVRLVLVGPTIDVNAKPCIN